MNYEHALLGCIIIEPNQGLYVCKDKRITIESFACSDARMVFAAIDRLAKVGKPVDVVTVENELADKIGCTVSSMLDTALTIAHVEHYADEVKNAQRRKSLSNMVLEMEKALEEGDATDEIISKVQADIVELTDLTGVKAFKLGDLKDQKIEQWETAQKSGFVGVPFHLTEVNRALGGLRKKCMSILAGYRGEGKSTLARDWALQCAKSGMKVALFSLEDPADIASASIVGNHAEVNVFGLDTGLCSPNKIGAMKGAWNEVADLPLWIMSGAMDIDAIDTTARLLKMKHGLDLVIIDHIQYIPPYIMKGMSRNDTVAYYSSRTVGIADALDVHVCNCSQFSRSSEKENRKPRLSDLRDSGTLEQDCRSALLLYYDGEKEHHMLEIAKNNYGRSGVAIDVERVDGKQRFREIRT